MLRIWLEVLEVSIEAETAGVMSVMLAGFVL